MSLSSLTTGRKKFCGARSLPNVLLLIEHLEVGGAERMVVDLAVTLHSRSLPVTVCLYRSKGLLASELEQAGVDLFLIPKKLVDIPLIISNRPLKGIILFLESIIFVARLALLLRRRHVDVIHTHMFSAGLWGRLAARLARPTGRLPVIVTEHTLRSNGESRKHQLLNRMLMPWTDAIVAVSQDVANHVEHAWNLPPGQVIVIPNAVDLAPFEEVAKRRRDTTVQLTHPFTIAFVGRLVPIKRLDLLFDAIALSRVNIPSLRCLIIGDGPERARLQNLTRRLGLTSDSGQSDTVQFLGLRRDLAVLFEQVDALINSSDREGLPMSVLEAFAAALPVVATNVGGTAEVVITGRTGVLIPPGDVKALASAIQFLASSPSEAQTMGRAGQELVRQSYSLENVANRWIMLYQRLCGRLVV